MPIIIKHNSRSITKRTYERIKNTNHWGIQEVQNAPKAVHQNELIALIQRVSFVIIQPHCLKKTSSLNATIILNKRKSAESKFLLLTLTPHHETNDQTLIYLFNQSEQQPHLLHTVIVQCMDSNKNFISSFGGTNKFFHVSAATVIRLIMVIVII